MSVACRGTSLINPTRATKQGYVKRRKIFFVCVVATLSSSIAFFLKPSFHDTVGRSFAKRTATNNYTQMEVANGIDEIASVRAGENIPAALTEVEEEEEIQAVEKREVSCRWLSYRGEIQVCAHPGQDLISDTIARHGRWGDCDSLPALWLELSKVDRSRGKFLDLGANIGSCSMEMLLATDAHIVSVEANPENFLRLQKTVSNLSDKFKGRIKVFNVVASNVIEDIEIFGATLNMGNSVVGKAVGDVANQAFHQSLSVRTQRMDDIFGKTYFSAMKMDVQGYECKALEGMNKVIRNIRTIKFEVANRWLLAQECSDIILFEKLRIFGFEIYHGSTILAKPLAHDVYDVVAKRSQQNGRQEYEAIHGATNSGLATMKNKNKMKRNEGSLQYSKERLSRYSLFHPTTNGAPESANAWYQNNVEPAVSCSHEERIGPAGEGGKWMCDIDALRNKNDCLVYSIGRYLFFLLFIFVNLI